jgi:hypothetical protein
LRDEKKCFDLIRKHRNRLVHFFHPSYVGSAKRKAISEVAVEQFRAWMLISRLLNDQWPLEFARYSDDIASLDRLIHKNRGFLQFKFNTVRPTLEKYKKSGGGLAICRSCQFLAAELTHRNPVQSSLCLVCNARRDEIAVTCPECKEELIECSDGDGTCPGCDARIGMTHLLDKFGPSRYYCSNCEFAGVKTVVPWDDGVLCLYCAETFPGGDYCEYCGEPVAGVGNNSYLSGCIFCDGRFGDDRD